MTCVLVDGSHMHEWVVFSTFVDTHSLFVQCVDCGMAGTVDDPSRKEWKRAFHAPGRPYIWKDESRINQMRTLPLHVIRTIPSEACDCPKRKQGSGKYERFPAEITTPDLTLTAEEKVELKELADFVRESDLCSYWFPVFLRGYQLDSGRIFPQAVHTITDRIEQFDSMGLHCSPAVVARVLTEFANALPRKQRSASIIGDVLPARDHYWLLHDGEKYARHGTEEKNGVLVFDCQERAEQFMLSFGKALPDFKPVKVSASAFLDEVKRAGAFSVAEGPLKVRVCEISKQ